MMRRRAGLATSVSLAGCIVITCSACSVLRRTETALSGQSRMATPAPQTRWAQVASVRPATFAVCVEPACPKATLKTLASAAIPVAVVLRTPAVQSAPIDHATPVTLPPELSQPPQFPQQPPRSAVRPLPVEPTEIVFSAHGGA